MRNSICSGRITPSSERRTALLMAFFSSRIFPGQGYLIKRFSISSERSSTFLCSSAMPLAKSVLQGKGCRRPGLLKGNGDYELTKTEEEVFLKVPSMTLCLMFLLVAGNNAYLNG